MGKALKNVFKNDHFSLTECTDGFYLWDEVLQHNISMYHTTEQEALLNGLKYYQKRLAEVSKEHRELSEKVHTFIAQVLPEEEEG